MKPPILNYDELADTMTVSFETLPDSLDVCLNDQIIVHFDEDGVMPIGITLKSYSMLVEPTPHGSRLFALTKLGTLPQSLRVQVLRMMNVAPLNQIIELQVFTPYLQQSVMLVAIKPLLHLQYRQWQLYTHQIAPRAHYAFID